MRTNSIFDKHTLDIVKAAMPHVHPRAQGGMSVLLKANDLMNTIEDRRHDEGLSAMEVGSWTPDPEELLLSIKEVATPDENEILDTILNFLKARKIYSAYQSYSDTVMEAQGLGGGNRNYRRNPFASMLGPFGGMGNRRNQHNGQGANNNGNSNQNNAGNTMNAAGSRQNNGQMPSFMNFLMSQLSPEQKQTFDMFNMMMNSMPPGNSGNVSGQNVKNDGKNQMKSQSLAEEDENTAKEGSES